MSLISVVLGTAGQQQRDATSLALLDYGFSQFTLRTPLRRDEVLARPAVQDRPGTHVAVVAARGLQRWCRAATGWGSMVRVPRQLSAPLPAQAVVGTATVTDGGRVVDRIPLRLDASG